MAKLETVRVVNPEGGFFRINKSDYNPSKHTLYVEGAPGQPLENVPADAPKLDPDADPSLPNETATLADAPADEPEPAPKKKGKRG